MAKSNDDLANALNALAAGDVADDHHGGSGVEHHQQQPAPPAAPKSARPPAAKAPAPAKPVAKPAAPQPPAAAARPTAPASSRPAQPGTPPPARAAAPTPQRPAAPATPAVPPEARPAAPARPVAPPTPAEPPPAPVVRTRPAAPPVRPTAPPPPAEPEAEHVEQAYVEGTYEEGADALEHGQIVEGEEMDIAAPNPDVFRARPKAAPAPRKHYTHTIQFKQTIIPVLLTVGALCLISAVIPYIAPADSNLSAMKQPLFLGVMAAVGVLFLLFGVLNALQVKSILDSKR